MAIHTAPDHIRELVKAEVERTMQERYHMSLADIPGVTGIGIGDDSIIVTTEDDLPWQYKQYIPTDIARIPVYVQYVGPTFREEPAELDEYGFYYQMRQRGQAGVAQSGAVIHGRESGTCFGVLVDSQGRKYAVCSSHVLAPVGNTASIGGRQIGKVTKDLRHCGGMTHVDAAAVLLNQGVQTNATMIGINAVCAGFVKPQVGMTIYTSGANSGNTTQRITTTNYSLRNDTGGNCMTNFQDIWIGSVRSKPGDSVSNDTRLYWWEESDLKFGTMDDLFLSYHNSNQASRDRFYVLSVHGRGRKDAQVIFTKINDVMYHGIKPVWRVELHNGKSIEITQDHSIFCLHDFWNLRTATLDELTGVASVDNFPANTGGQRHALLFPDLCTFLGLWMADGSYCRDSRNENRMRGVAISTGSNKDVCNWLDDLCSTHYCRTLGSGRVTRVMQYKKKGDVNLWSTGLAATTLRMFGDVNSYTKRVPKELFISDCESIAAFLRGYFSGDGSIHFRGEGRTVIDCSSVNRGLVEDISVLLDRLGIRHNISKGFSRGLCWGKYQQRLQYKLRIEYGLAVNKFMRLVGFIQKNKPFEQRTKFRDERESPLSRRTLRTVEYVGEKAVYDISTQNERFVANGILCHNSGANMVTQQNGKYYSVGVLTTNNNRGSVNCSSWYMVQEFGITGFLGQKT